MAISPAPMGCMDPQDTQPQEPTGSTTRNAHLVLTGGLPTAGGLGGQNKTRSTESKLVAQTWSEALPAASSTWSGRQTTMAATASEVTGRQLNTLADYCDRPHCCA